MRGIDRREWLGKFPFLKHIGLYAYRREVLREVTQLPPSSLEQAESLEQLRWLQNGYRIRVGLTDVETIGIDTPDDLARAEAFITKASASESQRGAWKMLLVAGHQIGILFRHSDLVENDIFGVREIFRNGNTIRADSKFLHFVENGSY